MRLHKDIWKKKGKGQRNNFHQGNPVPSNQKEMSNKNNNSTISPKRIVKFHADAEKYAEAVQLTYVTGTEAGIQRYKKGKGFIYIYEGKQIKKADELLRIKKLVIPPAWKNVWICRFENGHLQATGIDVKNRKQYKYHALWNQLRNETKFYRLVDFGNSLPQLRLQIEKDINQPDLSQQKVIATVISLMERTFIRIGNNEYKKVNGSYGLTTLKDQHVKINGGTINFSFKGKSGIYHDIKLSNRKLARIVKQCREIPGKELFQYLDEQGERHSIDSGKVNQYIQEVTGKDFTAKDFRTWAGSLHALNAFKNYEAGETASEIKTKVIEVLNYVSRKLGNSRTICKKYYVHPVLITLFESKNLKKYTDELDQIEKTDEHTGLTNEEKMLMKIMRKANAPVEK